jgi:hypothetical protein
VFGRDKSIIQKPLKEVNRIKSIGKHSLRQAGWLACLILVVALATSVSGSALDTIRQALGVRRLLQAETGIPNDEL